MFFVVVFFFIAKDLHVFLWRSFLLFEILFSKISFFYVFFSKNNKNLLHIKVKTIKESIFYPSKKETMTKKEQTVGERIDQATHTISETL